MRNFKFIFASVILAFASTVSSANSLVGGLTPYSQDFETLDASGLIIGDNWLFVVNVFEDDTFLFNYGFSAPNGPQISALVSDQGAVNQGVQQLSVYSDYECCSPSFGHRSTTGLGLVETNVFQEQVIGSANVGEQWTLSFDVKRGNIEGASTAFAFVKVLDPNNGFSLSEFTTLETTAVSTLWSRYSIDITIGDWAGQLLQFGFLSNAGNFEGSGMFYDNVDFSRTAIPLPGALLFMISGLSGMISWRGKSAA